MTFGVLVGSEPNVRVARGLVQWIQKVVDMTNIILHTVQGVDTSRVGIDATLVSPCLAHVLPVLVEYLDAIETYVEQIAMCRVQVDLEHEAHRHGNRIALLEVRCLVC